MEPTTNDKPEAEATVTKGENAIELKESDISQESSGIIESEEEVNAVENKDDSVERKEENSTSNDTMEDVTKQVLGESSVDHDDEVAAVTTVQHDEITATTESLSVMDGKASAGSVSSRPKTPEVAQLRNKFESNTLSAADGANGKNDHAKEARARSPSNRVKDMINRFTA